MTAPCDLPTEFRTPRLLLRSPRPEDAPAQVRAIAESHAELRRWMAWAQEVQTLQQATENLTQAQEAYRRGENLRLLVWSADGRDLIGSSGFHSLDWRVPRAFDRKSAAFLSERSE